MKKITKLVAVAFLFTFSFGLSTVQAQNPKKVAVKTDVKTQILGEWKFHEITLRTPKDGFLVHIAEQEVNIIKLLIANYTFNKDWEYYIRPKIH